ncbi:MAG TPA: hypothetical protein VNO84_03695 [Burkholderiaceae bacterium]|nr:hypothetical protein [Burkholderiaceae bacterium]
MKPASASAIASTVLARHLTQREPQRTGGTPAPTGTATAPAAGMRQYQVLQSRSEPGQRTLALRMR